MTHALSLSQFTQFKSYIAARTEAGTLTSTDILLYNIVRSKDLKRGFTPLTNPGRLGGVGRGEWSKFKDAKDHLKYQLSYNKLPTTEMFGEPLSAEVISLLTTALTTGA